MLVLGALLIVVAGVWTFWLSWFDLPPHTGVQGMCQETVYESAPGTAAGFKVVRSRPRVGCPVVIEQMYHRSQVAVVRADADGRFRVDLRPGTYQVRFLHDQQAVPVTSTGARPPQTPSAYIEVRHGLYTMVQLEQPVDR
ncbi:hypothetical protein FRUB_07117 [Fimbriiglobus ruber]|uniref:Carboxypeptidase regulatory-like domain-containing protein n=2 Tax=Fimbriiglobus ruber TaxID=1908690 RepID=A0A225DPA4_9BACT|nr:hypothetical protein FRUB_07117 [Fimbriiglobus ruber]